VELSFRNLLKPIRNPGFLKLFLVAIALVTGIVLLFIHPGKLDASDFMLIAWEPGQELLKTASVYAGYPYPIWTAVVMLPFAIWNPQTAMGLFFACNLLMLAASLALFVLMFDWEISPALFVLVMALSGFFLPVLTSLWLGQLTIFSFFMLALTAYLFRHQRWTRLGVVLGLSFIKPQIMILLAGLILLWAMWQKRWKVLLGFGAVILILTLISIPFINFPGQIIGGGISSHLSTYIRQTSTLWGLLMDLGSPWSIPLLICAGLLLWLGWTWYPLIRGKAISPNRVLFLFSAAILVNLMAVPYSWMHSLVLLLLPFGYSMNLARKLKSSERAAWLVLLFVLMQPLMLGIFITLNDATQSQAYQIIPAVLLLPVMCFLERRTGQQMP
jgi:hypothetical protein